MTTPATRCGEKAIRSSDLDSVGIGLASEHAMTIGCRPWIPTHLWNFASHQRQQFVYAGRNPEALYGCTGATGSARDLLTVPWRANQARTQPPPYSCCMPICLPVVGDRAVLLAPRFALRSLAEGCPSPAGRAAHSRVHSATVSVDRSRLRSIIPKAGPLRQTRCRLQIFADELVSPNP